VEACPVRRCRPRVTGLRESEILEATAAMLVEHGYDRLTLDVVAAAAHVSKATLYRRWAGKAELVMDAVGHVSAPDPARVVDTGSLRTDLLELSCGLGGLTDTLPLAMLSAVGSAMQRDPVLFAAVTTQITAPSQRAALRAFEAGRDRGEVADDADLQVLARVLPALSMHQVFVLGEPLTAERIAYLVDTVVLPACRAPAQHPEHPRHPERTD